MSKGHISLPRELFEQSFWLHYPLRYRAVFEFIILKCMWSPFEYDIAGKIFILQPGQMMTTKSRFVDDFNRTVKFKDDQINGTTLLRIWAFLTRDQMLDQQTVQHMGHKETLITIKHSMFYEYTFKKHGPTSGPAFGPKTDQERTNNKRTHDKENNKHALFVRAGERAIVDGSFVISALHTKEEEIYITYNEILTEMINLGYSEEQTKIALEILKNNNPTLNGTISAYLSGIIKNTKQDNKKCKKTKNQTQSSTPNSSETCNKTFSKKDLSEAPLAKFARQNGFK